MYPIFASRIPPGRVLAQDSFCAKTYGNGAGHLTPCAPATEPTPTGFLSGHLNRRAETGGSQHSCNGIAIGPWDGAVSRRSQWSVPVGVLRKGASGEALRLTPRGPPHRVWRSARIMSNVRLCQALMVRLRLLVNRRRPSCPAATPHSRTRSLTHARACFLACLLTHWLGQDRGVHHMAGQYNTCHTLKDL